MLKGQIRDIRSVRNMDSTMAMDQFIQIYPRDHPYAGDLTVAGTEQLNSTEKVE